MIPITLVTGFLGSGKTSLLKEIIKQNSDRKFVYLVNEFSPADIDCKLINNTTSGTVSIPGGSIFCKCLVTQFIHQLSDIPDKFSKPDHPVERVVIEASGIADPKVIRKMLRETHLSATYELQAVVSVVDPVSFPKLLNTLPNIRSQIEAADIIFLNKIDLVSDSQVNQTEISIREITPQTPIIKTTHCQFTGNILSMISKSPDLTGEYAKCADPHYSTMILKNNIHSVKQIKSIIEPIAEDIYRLKGFLKTDTETYYLDYSASGWEISSPFTETDGSGISIIVNGANRKKVIDYLKDLELL